MVSTRHSLPNVAPVNPRDDDPSVPKELRRLHINGKDTMRGTKVDKPKEKPKDNENVYYWRGTAYEITPDTPQAWIDQDPRRKRERLAAEEAAMNKTLKRKSTSALEGTTRNSDHDTTNTHHDEEDGEMAYETRRASKRQRRNTINHVPAKSTRQRNPSTTATTRPRRTSTKQANTEDNDATLKFDFTKANHERILSDIEARKEAAREKGYTVDMLSIEEMDMAKQRRKSQPQTPSTVSAKLVRDIAKMAKLNDAIANMSQEYERAKKMGIFEAILERKNARLGRRTTARPARAIHEEEEEEEDDDEAEVVDLNEDGTMAINVPTIEVEPSSDDLAGDDLRLADAVDQVYDERDTQSQIESQLNDEMNEDEEDDTLDPLSLPNTITREAHPARSESEGSSEGNSSKRQDSATSSLRTSIEEGDISQNTKSASPTTARKLPNKNKNGDRLRWSIGEQNEIASPPKGISKQTRYSSVSSGDRAEGLIHKGRLNGESKGARRRRVRRELDMMKKWPIDREASAGAE